MKLYNTLTRKVETFEPRDMAQTRLYSCGPTVYDHVHIGNLSAFIVADTLQRVLKLNDHKVTHVMNITDIDDKTIRRSHEQYAELEAHEALKKLTDTYTDSFFTAMSAVGNDLHSYEFTKATDYIPAMQKIITELHDNGFAYIADDGVYFSIEKYRASGKRYGQLTDITERSTSEARIQNDEYDKASIHDFALWKKQKPNEPSWEFELAGEQLDGRPGWHIECSAMSVAKLGQPFDIHTGGIDLMFPHHENEIAQSTAGKDDPVYAHTFMHNEHMLVDGQKMSKRLNNFYTVSDITAKGYEPLAFRLLVLQGHYRSQAHFSWENLQAAQNRLKGYAEAAVLLWQPLDIPSKSTAYFTQAIQDIQTLLCDDVNSAAALASLSAFMDSMKSSLLSIHDVAAFKTFLQAVDALLGLQLLAQTDITEAQKAIVQSRESARAKKDWTTSDERRAELAAQGIGLRDTKTSTIWYRL